jgi:catechol 2,3-dioxygenase-like lactoylglutathione lyase family enzyme
MSTRIRAAVTVLMVLLVTVGLWLSAAPGSVTPAVDAVAGVAIPVSDMTRSIDFYSRVLTFDVESDVTLAGDAQAQLHGLPGVRLRVVRLRLGSEAIELVEYLTPRGRGLPSDSRSQDHWFQHIAIIVNDMDQAHEWLRRHRVEPVSPEPQRLPDWNPNAAGIRAFYFKDPDGHPLEILQFPPGKGDVRWQRPGERVFLGIDHTAIVVAQTETSLAFYRDALGMRVVGESRNHGPEQERLNNVAGASLRITTLRAAAGPGVELLEYLTPRDGRPRPGDARSNDLVGVQTLLVVPDAAAAARALEAARAVLPPGGFVRRERSPRGASRGLLTADPDGHALQLRQR